MKWCNEWQNGPEYVAPSGTSAVQTPWESELSGWKPTAQCGQGLEAAHGFDSLLPDHPPLPLPGFQQRSPKGASSGWFLLAHHYSPGKENLTKYRAGEAETLDLFWAGDATGESRSDELCRGS